MMHELDDVPSPDLHHGEYSHESPLSELHIYGADPTTELLEALADIGLANIVPKAEGFVASRA